MYVCTYVYLLTGMVILKSRSLQVVECAQELLADVFNVRASELSILVDSISSASSVS
jgi:hypothetical protein